MPPASSTPSARDRAAEAEKGSAWLVTMTVFDASAWGRPGGFQGVTLRRTPQEPLQLLGQRKKVQRK
jgi:hypothetical protein